MIDKKSFFSKLNLFSGTISELLDTLDGASSNKGALQVVVTPNAEQVVLAKKSKSFAKILGAADIAIPDGIGVVFASRLLSLVKKSLPISERIPGVNVVGHLLYQAEKKAELIIVVGGRSYSNLRYAGLSVRVADEFTAVPKSERHTYVWWLPAYEEVTKPTSTEEAQVVATIQNMRPDYVFVAFGAPMQEEWLSNHRELLAKSGVRVAMAVGGAFDMLLGLVPRAPKIVQKIGLEWLFRLLIQPWRWRRQLKLLTFIKIVAQELVSP